ncbi:MAG TPA: PDZ domain-containing protein [Gemmatimonadaceae bacterium]
MRISPTAFAVLLFAATSPARAQPIPAPEAADVPHGARAPQDARGTLGLSLSLSRNERDTLGALVSSVVRNGPADKAGVDQGNRLVAINGVEIRASASDVGTEGDDALQRRVNKALRGVRAGEEVLLRVYSGGRARNVTAIAAADGPPAEARIVAQGQPRAADVVAPLVSPTVSVASAPAPAAPAATTPPPAPTVTALLDALRAVRMQLRRVEQDAGTGPSVDSLDQLDDELGQMQRRLRAIQATMQRTTGLAPAVDDSPLPGIRTSLVTNDLAGYFGDDSEGGLLVLDADVSWAPLRKGDVVLRVEGQPVTSARLRTALTQGQRVEVLRRARTLTLTLRAKDGA